MKQNDGGPAFPQPVCDVHGETMTQGMSLRDYFAGQSLVGIICFSHPDAPLTNYDPVRDARTAYEFADAMLQARENPVA